MNTHKSDKLGNYLSGLFVAALLVALSVIGIAPNQANGALRAVAGGSGTGSVPTATCSTAGGLIYSSAGAFTCNTNLATDGNGTISSGATISFSSGGASTAGATIANNIFTLPSGAVGAPSLSIGGASTGLFSVAGNQVSLTAGGAESIRSSASTITLFGNVSMSGATTFTPAQINGIVGTTTNNNAQAGSWGEEREFSVASTGAVVTASSNTPITVVSTGATVTAGDYDVQGLTCYISAASTSFTVYKQGISTATNTFGALGTYSTEQFAAMVPLATTTSENCRLTPTVRISLSGTSTVFMVAAPIFTVSANITTYGFIRLRRVR